MLQIGLGVIHRRLQRQQIVVDDLYTLSENGRYWYEGGYNRNAILAIIPSALVPAICALVPSLSVLANFTWFIGVGLGYGIYNYLMLRQTALASQPA